MRITEFKLSNYKSFGDYQNPVKGIAESMKALNMFFGHNNSGKSNAIKFIELVFSRKVITEPDVIVEGVKTSPKVRLGSFRHGLITNSPYIYHKNDRNRKISFHFKVELANDEIQNSGFEQYDNLMAEYPAATANSLVEFTGEITNLGDPFTSTFEITQVILNNREAFATSADGAPRYFQTGNAHALDGDALVFDNFIGIFDDSVMLLDTDRFFSNETEDNSEVRLSPKRFKNWLHNLSLNPLDYEKYEKFINFVRKQNIAGMGGRVFKNFTPTYSKLGNEIEILLSNGAERLPLNSFGTGIQQILIFLALIFETKARIILIEELELNLSPTNQRELLQIIRNLIREKLIDQVIFSTHSGYLRSTTDFGIYEVAMNSAGVSTITKLPSVRTSFFNNRRL